MSYTLEQVKDIIRKKINHEVISKEYISTRNLLDIKCICGVIFLKFKIDYGICFTINLKDV